MTSPWRTMSVELSADSRRYVQGMRDAERATKSFGDQAAKSQGAARDEIDKSASALDRFVAQGDRLDDIGNKWTRNVTLPVAAAGGVATKMATDYNNAFTQMQSLAGVTADEVAGLKDAVDSLSAETARSPQELAEGLYNVRSSGLEGAAAMEVLEVSAKGAAIGLGETRDLTDLLTSVMNAYAGTGLTAAQATDQLVEAIAQGKAEPGEMAGQMGRLLPIASELGIEFDQVAGSLGFLTLTSGDTAQSATQLAGIMQKILRPTRQGAKELEAVGLSAAQLKEIVAEQGLLPALQLLEERFGGNSEAMGRVFDDAEGLNGVLALLGSDGGAAAEEVLNNVAVAAGNVGESFARLDETDEFKFQQALNDLKRLAIEVGQELIPVLSDVADVASTVLGVFNSLPGPVKDGLLILAGGAALVGPLAKGLSGVASGIGSVQKAVRSDAFGRFVDKIGLTPGRAGLAAGALGAVGLAAYGLGEDSRRAADRAAKLAASIDDLRTRAEAAGRTIEEEFIATDLVDLGTNFRDEIDDIGLSLEDLQAGLTGTQEDFDRMIAASDLSRANLGDRAIIARLQAYRDQVVGATKETEDQADARAELNQVDEQGAAVLQQLADATSAIIGPASSATGELEGIGEATYDAADAAEGLAGAYDELESAIDDAYQSLKDFYGIQTSTIESESAARDAIAAVGETVRQNVEANKDYAKSLDITTEAGRENVDAMLAARDAVVDHALNVARQTGDVDRGAAVLNEYTEELRRQAREAGLNEQEIDYMIQTMKLTPTEIETEFKTKLADVERNEAILQLLARTREVLLRPRVDTSAITGAARGVLGRFGFAGGGHVPGPDVNRDIVPAMLTPGEVVIRKASVRRFGLDNLLALNSGRLPSGWMIPGYASGGVVGAPGAPVPPARSPVVQVTVQAPSGGIGAIYGGVQVGGGGTPSERKIEEETLRALGVRI